MSGTNSPTAPEPVLAVLTKLRASCFGLSAANLRTPKAGKGETL